MSAKDFIDAITRVFDNAKEALEGIEEKERLRFRGNIIAHPIIYYNADGSVDAELRVDAIPNELSVNKLITAIERHLSPVAGAFYQGGVRYHPREGEPVYTKFMGMSQAESWYHGELVDTFATVKKIDENMRQAGRKKPKQVFIRAHWNPEGIHPKVRWQT